MDMIREYNRPDSPSVVEEIERPPKAESPSPCAICLDHVNNKSFTNSCLHIFCYECLRKWAEIKTTCPLCQQTFSRIMYNIRSIDDYDVFYTPLATGVALTAELEIMNFVNYVNSNRIPLQLPELAAERENPLYPEGRIHVTVPQPLSRSLVIQPYVDNSILQRRNPTVGRDRVYMDNMFRLAMNSSTARLSSPEFYRENEAQTFRVLDWVRRELIFLSRNWYFNEENTMTAVTNALNEFPITSEQFVRRVTPYLGGMAEKFCDELYSFATSPYEIIEYDERVRYCSPFDAAVNMTGQSVSTELFPNELRRNVEPDNATRLAFLRSVTAERNASRATEPNTSRATDRDPHRPLRRWNLSSAAQAQRTHSGGACTIDLTVSDDDDEVSLVETVPRRLFVRRSRRRRAATVVSDEIVVLDESVGESDPASVRSGSIVNIDEPSTSSGSGTRRNDDHVYSSSSSRQVPEWEPHRMTLRPGTVREGRRHRTRQTPYTR